MMERAFALLCFMGRESVTVHKQKLHLPGDDFKKEQFQ